jgi:hypothetical protein
MPIEPGLQGILSGPLLKRIARRSHGKSRPKQELDHHHPALERVYSKARSFATCKQSRREEEGEGLWKR